MAAPSATTPISKRKLRSTQNTQSPGNVPFDWTIYKNIHVFARLHFVTLTRDCRA